MNPDRNRADTDNVNADIGNAGVDQQATAASNPFLSLHRLLQGKYPYAIVLAIVGGVACGLAGYILPEPIYRSTGMIRYKPVLPRLLYKSEDSTVMPMFDAYMASQAQLLKSQRVMDLAMQDEAWRSHKVVFTTSKQVDFRNNLVVNKGIGSTIVYVSFTDSDPSLARIAVRTVINAYARIYGEKDNIGETSRLQLLEQRRVALTNQMASIRSRTLDLASDFGSDALDQMYGFKLKQLNELEQALTKVGISLASAGVPATEIQVDDGSSSEDAPTGLTVEEIGTRDRHMRQLLDHRNVLEQGIKLMQVRLGDNHRNIVELQTKIGNEMTKHEKR